LQVRVAAAAAVVVASAAAIAAAAAAAMICLEWWVWELLIFAGARTAVRLA
jgi:hypothetical protein